MVIRLKECLQLKLDSTTSLHQHRYRHYRPALDPEMDQVPLLWAREMQGEQESS